MEGVICTDCGQKHEINGQFCKFCGNDLEKEILTYKRGNLPIIFTDGGKEISGPYEAGSKKEIRRSKKETMNPFLYFLYRLVGVLLDILAFIFVAFCNAMCSSSDDNSTCYCSAD